MFQSIVEGYHKKFSDKYKDYEVIVLILGPAISKKTDGANLRKTLKQNLEKHIKRKYNNAKIEICYPEEAEGKPGPVDINLVKFMMEQNETKLIIGVWEKGVEGLIPEVDYIAENKNIALKSKIFIDKNLWNKHTYITNRNNLNVLHNVFNSVYIVDFKDAENILTTAKQIFDGYSKWAVDKDGIWPGDV